MYIQQLIAQAAKYASANHIGYNYGGGGVEAVFFAHIKGGQMYKMDLDFGFPKTVAAKPSNTEVKKYEHTQFL